LAAHSDWRLSLCQVINNTDGSQGAFIDFFYPGNENDMNQDLWATATWTFDDAAGNNLGSENSHGVLPSPGVSSGSPMYSPPIYGYGAASCEVSNFKAVPGSQFTASSRLRFRGHDELLECSDGRKLHVIRMPPSGSGPLRLTPIDQS
jgi:hypothetical protein